MLLDIADKDGDHRYPHNTLSNKYVSVLTNTESDCSIWYASFHFISFHSPNIFIDLCNLGAKALLDYDFYDSLTDKVSIISVQMT